MPFGKMKPMARSDQDKSHPNLINAESYQLLLICDCIAVANPFFLQKPDMLSS